MERRDVRTDSLKPQTISIHVQLVVVTEMEPKGFLSNLSDELAAMLGDRLEKTPGMVHLKTDEWDVSMQ